MEQGWIKLYRKIAEDDLWFAERFTRAQAWIDLLLLANHRPRTIFIRGVEIFINRGQLAYSKKNLAKRWRWNGRTVTKFLDSCVRRGKIQVKTSNVTTSIKIINYDKYQGNGDQSTQQIHTKAHTNKNDKNISNNDKKRRYKQIIEREKSILAEKEQENEEAENFKPDFDQLYRDLSNE